MNRVFYIFRHGETDWNKEHRCQGHTNILLNDNGLAQAIDLAQRLEGIEMDIIVTSDLERAFVTGNTVALKKSIPIKSDPRLRELSCGEAEGMLFDEAVIKFGAEFWHNLKVFKPEHEDICFPAGETRRSARERFLAVLHELIETTEHRFVGISTHGGILRSALHSFLPAEHPALEIPNCVLYRLIYDSEKKEFQFDSKPYEFLLKT
jgi:broad specificity phosphatase PhoE